MQLEINARRDQRVPPASSGLKSAIVSVNLRQEVHENHLKQATKTIEREPVRASHSIRPKTAPNKVNDHYVASPGMGTPENYWSLESKSSNIPQHRNMDSNLALAQIFCNKPNLMSQMRPKSQKSVKRVLISESRSITTLPLTTCNKAVAQLCQKVEEECLLADNQVELSDHISVNSNSYCRRVDSPAISVNRETFSPLPYPNDVNVLETTGVRVSDSGPEFKQVLFDDELIEDARISNIANTKSSSFLTAEERQIDENIQKDSEMMKSSKNRFWLDVWLQQHGHSSLGIDSLNMDLISQLQQKIANAKYKFGLKETTEVSESANAQLAKTVAVAAWEVFDTLVDEIGDRIPLLRELQIALLPVIVASKEESKVVKEDSTAHLSPRNVLVLECLEQLNAEKSELESKYKDAVDSLRVMTEKHDKVAEEAKRQEIKLGQLIQTKQATSDALSALKSSFNSQKQNLQELELKVTKLQKERDEAVGGMTEFKEESARLSKHLIVAESKGKDTETKLLDQLSASDRQRKEINDLMKEKRATKKELQELTDLSKARAKQSLSDRKKAWQALEDTKIALLDCCVSAKLMEKEEEEEELESSQGDEALSAAAKNKERDRYIEGIITNGDSDPSALITFTDQVNQSRAIMEQSVKLLKDEALRMIKVESDLEQKVSSLCAQLEQEKIDHERFIDKLQAAYNSEIVSLQDRHEHVSQSLNDMIDSKDKEISQSKKEIASLRKSLEDDRASALQLQAELRDSIRSAQASTLLEQNRILMMEHDNMLQDQISRLAENNSRLLHRITATENDLASSKRAAEERAEEYLQSSIEKEKTFLKLAEEKDAVISNLQTKIVAQDNRNQESNMANGELREQLNMCLEDLHSRRHMLFLLETQPLYRTDGPTARSSAMDTPQLCTPKEVSRPTSAKWNSRPTSALRSARSAIRASEYAEKAVGTDDKNFDESYVDESYQAVSVSAAAAENTPEAWKCIVDQLKEEKQKILSLKKFVAKDKRVIIGEMNRFNQIISISMAEIPRFLSQGLEHASRMSMLKMLYEEVDQRLKNPTRASSFLEGSSDTTGITRLSFEEFCMANSDSPCKSPSVSAKRLRSSLTIISESGDVQLPSFESPSGNNILASVDNGILATLSRRMSRILEAKDTLRSTDFLDADEDKERGKSAKVIIEPVDSEKMEKRNKLRSLGAEQKSYNRGTQTIDSAFSESNSGNPVSSAVAAGGGKVVGKPSSDLVGQAKLPSRLRSEKAFAEMISSFDSKQLSQPFVGYIRKHEKVYAREIGLMKVALRECKGFFDRLESIVAGAVHAYPMSQELQSVQLSLQESHWLFDPKLFVRKVGSNPMEDPVDVAAQARILSSYGESLTQLQSERRRLLADGNPDPQREFTELTIADLLEDLHSRVKVSGGWPALLYRTDGTMDVDMDIHAFSIEDQVSIQQEKLKYLRLRMKEMAKQAEIVEDKLLHQVRTLMFALEKLETQQSKPDNRPASENCKDESVNTDFDAYSASGKIDRLVIEGALDRSIGLLKRLVSARPPSFLCSGEEKQSLAASNLSFVSDGPDVNNVSLPSLQRLTIVAPVAPQYVAERVGNEDASCSDRKGVDLESSAPMLLSKTHSARAVSFTDDSVAVSEASEHSERLDVSITNYDSCEGAPLNASTAVPDARPASQSQTQTQAQAQSQTQAQAQAQSQTQPRGSSAKGMHDSRASNRVDYVPVVTKKILSSQSSQVSQLKSAQKKTRPWSSHAWRQVQKEALSLVPEQSLNTTPALGAIEGEVLSLLPKSELHFPPQVSSSHDDSHASPSPRPSPSDVPAERNPKSENAFQEKVDLLNQLCEQALFAKNHGELSRATSISQVAADNANGSEQVSLGAGKRFTRSAKDVEIGKAYEALFNQVWKDKRQRIQSDLINYAELVYSKYTKNLRDAQTLQNALQTLQETHGMFDDGMSWASLPLFDSSASASKRFADAEKDAGKREEALSPSTNSNENDRSEEKASQLKITKEVVRLSTGVGVDG